MLRISNKKEGVESEISAAYIFHPDSVALEGRIRELAHEELKKFGLDIDDAHQIHNDLDFVRQQRETRKTAAGWILKALIVGGLSVAGALLLSGLTTYFGGPIS